MARDLPEPAPPDVAGLAYVSDSDPGIRRRRTRGGFRYLGPEGRALSDARTLERIRRLAVPPAWTEVWICPDPMGHIQATGRDQRGRKQYRYHDDWRQVRDADKFDRVAAFGRALPRLRRRIDRDLARPGLARDKVLAAVVRLMELTLIRVGNEEYARANRSFGLTTLRSRHATLTTAGGRFEFRGKGGKARRTGFRDRRLARVVKRCQDLPGQRLFQYLDDKGERRAVESGDVNAYLREAMGEDFSAKDFRTWAATIAAADACRMSAPGDGRRRRDDCVRAVAGLLGNTAAVCRGAYIHPHVLQAFEAVSVPFTGSGRSFELSVLRYLEETGPVPTGHPGQR